MAIVGEHSRPIVPAAEPVDTALSRRRLGAARVIAAGKLLMRNREPFYLRGVTYGTFAPDENGDQYPSQPRVLTDFRAIAVNGFNVVRTYTVPPARVLGFSMPPPNASCRFLRG
jgi:hypothetical protein